MELVEPLTFNEDLYSACLDVKSTNYSSDCLTTGWLTSETGELHKDLNPILELNEIFNILDKNREQYVKIASLTSATDCNSTVNYNGALTSDAVCASAGNNLLNECLVSLFKIHFSISSN